ncbi:MAG: CPBP family intramembrane glutamic endopeptidase [Chloroflexota bacterium]
MLSRIFLSPLEPRLRAGWRLLLQTLLLLLLASCIGVPVLFLTLIPIPGFDHFDEFAMLVYQVVEFIAVTLSVYLARRFLDKRPFAGLGLKLDSRTLPDLLAGVGIAALVMALIFGLHLALGWLTVEGFAWEREGLPSVLGGMALMFVIFALTGWNEELLSRGYHLQTLASGTNLLWAVVISSVAFGFLHLANPGATWTSAAGIFLAGLFLAYAYLRTGQLWLSIGLHLGWNFFEGPVFGFPVSGLDFFAMTRISVSGPELWTGGRFGPEAGLILIPGLLAGAIAVHLYGKYLRPVFADGQADIPSQQENS